MFHICHQHIKTSMRAAPTLRAGRGCTITTTTTTTTTTIVMLKHKLSVDMTCEGCTNAVRRVLKKLGGVQFDIDLPENKVCINSEHSMDTLLETPGK